MPGQMLSEDFSRNLIPDQIPQTGAPQATAPLSNNNYSTLAPGIRIRVSVPLLSLF